MNKKNKKIRLMGGIFIVLVLVLLVAPSLHAEDVCFEALEKCSKKAAISGNISPGPGVRSIPRKKGRPRKTG